MTQSALEALNDRFGNHKHPPSMYLQVCRFYLMSTEWGNVDISTVLPQWKLFDTNLFLTEAYCLRLYFLNLLHPLLLSMFCNDYPSEWTSTLRYKTPGLSISESFRARLLEDDLRLALKGKTHRKGGLVDYLMHSRHVNFLNLFSHQLGQLFTLY